MGAEGETEQRRGDLQQRDAAMLRGEACQNDEMTPRAEREVHQTFTV